jgi:hypothetical protein
MTPTPFDIVPEPPATTLTYDQSSQLMSDLSFRGRIKVAALKAATYYQGEDPTTPSHNSRYTWAQRCFASPDSTAQQLQPPVVMDAAVQTNGSAITDEALQGAVEDTIEKII